MPKIIRVSLTPQQRDQLNQKARAGSLPPKMRDRLEMIRLSDMGHTIPQIATVLGHHQQTVRKYLKLFMAMSQGREANFSFDLLADAPRSGRPPILTADHLLAMEHLLDEGALTGHTWTLRQLAEWLGEQFGITINPVYLSERLKERHFRWKRTQRSIHHKQKDPQLQAEKKVALETLNL
jgi:putative transposase